jgi:hypothetical protein
MILHKQTNKYRLKMWLHTKNPGRNHQTLEKNKRDAAATEHATIAYVTEKVSVISPLCQQKRKALSKL